MLRKPDAGGNTCLHLSVSKGHKDMVRELLGQYGSTKDLQEFINMSRSHNDTPLHIAASQGTSIINICKNENKFVHFVYRFYVFLPVVLSFLHFFPLFVKLSPIAVHDM